MTSDYDILWNQLINGDLLNISDKSEKYNSVVRKITMENKKEFSYYIERDLIKVLAKNEDMIPKRNIFNTVVSLFLMRFNPSVTALETMFFHTTDVAIKITSLINPRFPLEHLLDESSFSKEENPYVLGAWKITLEKRDKEVVPLLRKILTQQGLEHVDAIPDEIVKQIYGYNNKQS